MEFASDNLINKKPIDLLPYGRNSRVHSDEQIEQICNSIKEWGFTAPILIDEDDTVLAGHARLEASKKLGLETVPCMVAKNWTDEQKRAYVIADNKLAENSNWDMGIYFSELKEMNDLGFDLSLVGVDADSMNLSFNPNTEPSYNFNDIEQNDMENAQDKINKQISNLSAEDSDNAIELVCPHCSETFKFSGM